VAMYFGWLAGHDLTVGVRRPIERIDAVLILAHLLTSKVPRILVFGLCKPPRPDFLHSKAHDGPMS
jgi:hypothetical protein